MHLLHFMNTSCIRAKDHRMNADFRKVQWGIGQCLCEVINVHKVAVYIIFNTWYLILDDVGLKKLPLSIAPLFTWVQTVLEVINRSCRHSVIRKSVPMFDCWLLMRLRCTLSEYWWPRRSHSLCCNWKKVFLSHSFLSWHTHRCFTAFTIFEIDWQPNAHIST